MSKLVNHNLIVALLPNVILGGVISLQYVDDIVLFLDTSFDHARNLKWILSCFEKYFGMKIIFS